MKIFEPTTPIFLLKNMGVRTGDGEELFVTTSVKAPACCFLAVEGGGLISTAVEIAEPRLLTLSVIRLDEVASSYIFCEYLEQNI